ncbi:MAG: DUF1574 domain-containing protein [Candidatus Obscuribacterales bacterium]|jgi:hypothetical protein|nr:DUF1574 domain-containing protein [Candidatus Obscuribacterales bacterium]
MQDKNPTQDKENAKALSLWQSSAVLGLLLVLVINGIFVLWKPLAKVDPESLPSARTWVWWASHDFLSQTKAPDVVLLGSSLMMQPMCLLDADYLKTDLDYVKHHQSLYMADALKNRLNLPNTTPFTCFNFALPGGMASDDYIVTRSLLLGERKPKVIVLALTLRDFADSGVRCAGATPAFRYLKRFTEIDDLVALAMPQFWQQFDYWFGKSLYTWGKKLDIQVALAQNTQQFLKPFIQTTCPASQLSNLDLERNMPSNLRSEVQEGMMIMRPNDKTAFNDNTAEYRKRFRSRNEDVFATQQVFLEKLLQLAKDNDIKLLVVNMPVTQANLQLMPAGHYDKYISFLKSATKRENVAFIDLNGDERFLASDYYDTCHLRGTGGKKLVDAMVQEIAKQNELSLCLQDNSRTSPKVKLAGTAIIH